MNKYAILIMGFFISFTAVSAQISNADMKEVKVGSFSMGNSSFTRESPARTVNISTFYISKNIVTNAQFAEFINSYGSQTVKEGLYAGKKLFVTDSWGIVSDNGIWKPAAGFEQHPMIQVTWYGATEFCKWNDGRLPTEAEWEYAAKGGPTTQAFTYSGSSTATTVAWFSDNSGHLNKPVGTKAANTLGIFDMSGNVYQWCSDWFARYGEFGKTGETNPKGPQTGVSKVIRGGYRSIGSGDLHLTNRESISPDESYNFVGFRLVKESLPVGLKPVKKSEIQVYPNPASDYIHLNNVQNMDKLEITDLDGRVVFCSLNPTNCITVSGFPNGIYLLKFSMDSDFVIQKMVVKH